MEAVLFYKLLFIFSTIVLPTLFIFITAKISLFLQKKGIYAMVDKIINKYIEWE